MEKIRYIGKDGYGIPEWLFLSQINFINHIFTGGSGESLFATIRYRDLYIRQSNDRPPFFIAAYFDLQRAVRFNICTMGFNNDVNQRHPDLFAARLIEESITFFESMNKRIRYFEAEWMFNPNEWGITSVNGQKFLELICDSKITDSPVCRKAAKATWTGIIVDKMGFSRVEKIVELNDPNESDHRGVTVLFSRPEVS